MSAAHFAMLGVLIGLTAIGLYCIKGMRNEKNKDI